MNKKKILIITDSVKRQTGYSTVANNIINNLKDKFIVAQLGIADIPVNHSQVQLPIDHYSPLKDHSKCCGKGIVIELYKTESNIIEYIVPNLGTDTHNNSAFCPRGIPVTSDIFAQESAFFVIQHFKPDIVIAINDIWGIYHINLLSNRDKFVFIPYLAVDSECFPVRIKSQKPGLPDINTLQFMNISNKIVVFTNFAKDTINKTISIATQGKIASNIEIIPHGVDINSFHPLSNKDELRKKFFGFKPTDNIFLIGCVQRNQPRKRMDAVFQTLRILIDRYEIKTGKKFMVHFHCAMDDNMGWDLSWLAMYYGVIDRCIFDNQLRPGLGCPINVLNEIINTYDIHFTLTNSEGFGLPILETMSAGIPNVISDYSAHGDWAAPAALKVKLAAKVHETKTNHIKGIADINHAAKQISLLYNSNKMLNDYKNKSLKLAKELEWSKVCEQWITLINNTDISSLSEDRYNALTIDSNTIENIPLDPTTQKFKLTEI